MFGPNGTTAAALEALRRLGRATSVICSRRPPPARCAGAATATAAKPSGRLRRSRPNFGGVALTNASLRAHYAG